MLRFSVHPAIRLLAWLALLVSVQALSGVVLAAAFALLPLAGRRGLRRGTQLAWRARWLLASLLIILSWGVAGEPLWQGAAAPTIEGLGTALTHFARLLLVLFTVAAFLESMPLPELLAATHVLLAPLRHCGADPDRAVVRLLLVLRYVEILPRPRDWRALLKAPVAAAGECVEVDCQALRWSDGLIGAGLVAAVFCLLR